MDKLKPCPFCGGEPYVFCDNRLYNQDLRGVTCSACGVVMVVYNIKKEEIAIQKWNTRYEPPYNGSVPAGNERIKKVE